MDIPYALIGKESGLEAMQINIAADPAAYLALP